MKTLNRNIVLFLGAGFSCDAGLPTMPKFGSEAKRQNITQYVSGPTRNAAPLLSTAQQTFEDFQKLLEQSKVLSKAETENMEIVFCIAEALRESGVDKICINQVDIGIDSLIENIKLWLWKVYQQFPPENPKRVKDTRSKTYEDLFKIIIAANLKDRITVLSTNYDLVYEYCSFKSGVPCVYPFSWDTSFKAGHGNNHYIFQPEDDEGKTMVCKLHGSVNYFENLKESKENRKVFVASDLGDNQQIGKSGSWEGRVALFALDSIWNIRNKYGAEYTPSIIPPTYAKLRGYDWLRKIWETAFNAIVNSKKLIFIGYSFPESDGFIQAFFRGALAIKKNNHQIGIYVINPDNDVCNKIKSIFNNENTNYYPLTISEAINENIMKNILG